MANLYTSNLSELSNNSLEILIDRIADLSNVRLSSNKYSAQDQLIGSINPQSSYVENGGCDVNKTRVRLFFEANQVESGQKVQVKLDN